MAWYLQKDAAARVVWRLIMHHYSGKFSPIPCLASFFLRKTREAIRSVAFTRSLPRSCQKRYCSNHGHQRARTSALQRDESCPEHGLLRAPRRRIVVTHNLLRKHNPNRSTTTVGEARHFVSRIIKSRRGTHSPARKPLDRIRQRLTTALPPLRPLRPILLIILADLPTDLLRTPRLGDQQRDL